MTLEQYEARIKELERENIRLKTEIQNKRNSIRKIHPLVPQAVEELIGFFKGVHFTKSAQFRHMSSFVRMLVFEPSSVPSKRKHKSEFPEPILFSEMSDEQYDRYCRVMVRIINTLLENQEDADLSYLIRF